jgi:thiol-disulfide isomerase/thioredoxin
MLKTPEKSNLSLTRRQSLAAALAGAVTIGLGLRAAGAAEEALPIEGEMPPLASGGLWLNSAPLTREALRGKVVLVDFWTYSCINCQRTLPYVRDWHAKYHEQGLVAIGIHTPEFAYEKDADNVRRAVDKFGILYPVVLDNAYANWRAYGNEYWPAFYFIDAQGRIRRRHFGEGAYERNEAAIRQLLAEARNGNGPA